MYGTQKSPKMSKSKSKTMIKSPSNTASLTKKS